MEGLLGVLAAGENAGFGCGSAGADGSAAAAAAAEDGALATVRKEGLSLLLAAFSGFGGGRAADRLWRDCGAPVLEALVVAGGEVSATTQTAEEAPPRRRYGVWQDFLDGAVERTRRAMEDGDGGAPPDRAGTPPRGGAERAATLTWALVELQGTLLRRRAAPPEDAPVLWRLGLTRPSSWRERRLEALARAGAGATAVAADLARACVGSRWAQRWECMLLILARLPDARARLSLLTEGVVAPTDGGVAGDGGRAGVAGEALHEILAAGVVVSRAERLLRGGGYGGMATGDGLSVDLPPRLLSPAAATSTAGEGGAIGFDPVEEFGVGLPSFRGFLPAVAAAAPHQPGGMAAVASAGVLDAAVVHLGENPSAFRATPDARRAGEAATGTIAHRAGSRQQHQHHPFSLMLPQGLWRAAFGPLLAPAAAEDEDARLHGVVVSALLSGVKGMAEDAAAAALGGEGGEAGAWRVSCSAEVSTGLLVAAVGETFARGLGLGHYANRCARVCWGIMYCLL